MTERSVSLATPYRWLNEAVAMCRAHPRLLFGAAAVMLGAALLPSLLQLVLVALLKPSATVSVAIQVLFVILGLFWMPPITGGFYRVVHAVHEGRAVQPFDVFAVFGDAAAALRLIVTNLIFVVVTIALLALMFGLAFAFAGQALIDFFLSFSALKQGASLPSLPGVLLPLIIVLAIVMIVVSTAQQLAAAQVALSERSAAAAAGDALKVAVRNIGAWLLFYLPISLIAMVVIVVFGLVVGLVFGLLSALSPVLAGLLIAPLALALALVLYALVFCFYYQAWRDTLGPAGNIEPEHQIEA